eukprot:NODE_351_length_3136_cov_9.340645.p1 GENE.NODE_351_length_3136_cov_9.340645~~NODE_351_length_3136_cov_9.340645.p1  ORF type:complete len:543 (+),score=187.44 NODE_351_length_3136_cov_9.340645:82-1629(+)
MAPLMFLIFLLDPLNRKVLGNPMKHTCTWQDSDGGKAFVNVLSFSAHCELEGLSLVGDWDGLDCPQPAGEDEEVYEARPLGLSGYKHTKIPTSFIVYLEETVAEIGGTPRCDGLQTAFKDALTDKAEITSITRGGVTVDGAHFADAFDILYNRSVVASSGVHGGCACAKRVDKDTVPSYDFCDEDGKCLLEDPEGCGHSSARGFCAPTSNLAVTVTFSFQQNTVFHAIVNAYFRAAFLEEVLKYLAVRRILFKNRVADCGGLVVYGLASAAGFATVENVQYTLMHGVMVAYNRMVLAIPLHCLTGLMIGISLGYRKFVGLKHMWLGSWYVALIVPVLTHGTYDVFLMLPKYVPIPQVWRIIIVVGVVLLGIIYCRKMWLGLENVCTVDIHALKASGRIKPGNCCLCERDAIKSFRTHHDHLLAGSIRKKHGQDAPHEEESSDEEHSPNVAAAVAAEIVPPAPPTCQTKRGTCPQCSQEVRLQIFFPSFCPFCSFKNPDPRPPAGMSMMDLAAAQA